MGKHTKKAGYAINIQKLQKIITTQKNVFLNKLKHTRKLFGIEESITPIKKYSNYIDTARVRFIKKLDTEDFIKFLNQIQIEFLDKYHLGQEWMPYLADMVITSYFSVPKYNLEILVDDEFPSLKISLNGTTSQDDILQAWSEIKERQEEVFGSIKKTRYSMKFKANTVLDSKFNSTKRQLLQVRNTGKNTPINLDVLAQMDADSSDNSLSKTPSDDRRVIKKIQKRKERNKPRA